MQKRRKIVYIYPRLQGGVALAFAAVVFVGGILFSWHVGRDIRQALWDASLTGHYRFHSAYAVVGAIVIRHLAMLFAGTLLVGAALFFLGIRRIRIGTERIAEVFRISAEGDLSTPTDAPGPKELAALGKHVDTARSRTLEVIGRIRADIDLMRKEPLPDEEFLRRWEALKEKVGRVAR